MLRKAFLSLCFLTVSCGGTMEASFNWNVVYDPDVIPSCIVDFSDEYWDWRYAQGLPKDRQEDLASLYHRYLDLAAGRSNPPVAFCDGEFLMSRELARVMNSFGQNASPIAVYYQVATRWSEDMVDRDDLTLSQFNDLILSSIEEVESRF